MSDGTTEPLEGIDRESVTPDAVDPEEIRAALTHEDALVRQRGARTCAELAREDVEAARPFADELGALLEDESIAVARLAGTALLVIAEEHPGDLVDSLPAIVSLLDTDLGGIRLLGARLFSAVVLENAEACLPYFEEVVNTLETVDAGDRNQIPGELDEQQARAFQKQEAQEARMDSATIELLSNIVVAMAESEPGPLSDRTDDLVGLLSVENATVVGGAVDALAELADSDPASVDPAIEPLVDCLDHPATGVRARTILALGRLGDDSVLPEIKDVAENDENEDVREMAEEVADALEGG